MGGQAFDGKRDQMFHVSAEEDVVIIGLDTKDGPEHILYDTRAFDPLDEALVENIDYLNAVLEPAAVRKNGDIYEIIFGRGRTRGVREVNRRRREAGRKDFLRLPIFIMKTTEAELIKRMYSENAVRRADSPMARAGHIARFIDLGNSHVDASKVFGIGVQTIKTEVLPLLDLDKSVQKLVSTGKLMATAAVGLVSLRREEQKEAAEKLIASGTTTVADVRHEVKRNKAVKSGGRAEDVVKAPSKRELRRVLEANAALDADEQLPPDFIKGIRVALGDLSPAAIKGLTAMMAPPAPADAE